MSEVSNFFVGTSNSNFLYSFLQKPELNNCTRMWKFHKCIVACCDETINNNHLKNKGGVCIVINSLRSELRSSKAICSLDRWSSKGISRRQGNATDKKSTMPIPLLTTTDRSVVNNSGLLAKMTQLCASVVILSTTVDFLSRFHTWFF
ncbi:hypothetical protein T07_3084 [Trichinella nelsoni]|uniref:Uncharacterized protein n=1 Tax=Trichinella nelsoni TaxID=6336 RepID=A0A0V0S0N3_9BILA|nr:hypothetical protein T07_3084 [Trichinella nelsoni]